MIYTKIFVTGANGFIGSNIVKSLSENGHKISILLRKNASHPFLKELPLKHMQGDLFMHSVIDSAIANCDAIIHCAAFVSFDESDKREIYHVNVTGTNNICKYALKHKKRVVFVSTASTMGAPTKTRTLIDEKKPFLFKNLSSYSHSKYLAEQLVLAYVKKGLDAVIVNPSTVYGAGDVKGTGPSLYGLISTKPIFFAPPGGCSAIAVYDVVSGIIAALEKGKTGERYILTANNIYYKDLFKIILKESKASALPLITIPSFTESLLSFLLDKIKLQSKTITPTVLQYLFRFRYLNNEKALDKLHWKPIISLEQAVHEGYVFYKEFC